MSIPSSPPGEAGQINGRRHCVYGHIKDMSHDQSYIYIYKSDIRLK